jgi:hypothetical protein
MLFGIVTAVSRPKYSLTDMHFNSTTKFPITPKLHFSLAGIQMDDS